MKEPLKITYRGIEPTPAIEAKIRKRAAWLERYYDDIIGCHVTVEARHRSRYKAKLYNVRIDLKVKGPDVVVQRAPPQYPEHTDLYVAIRDAFDAARRRLQDYARRQRGDVKRDEQPRRRARVARLFPDEGYGFLETPDGREVYFNRNSVLNGGFDRLKEGMEVLFAEEQGTEGPQASTVVPV